MARQMGLGDLVELQAAKWGGAVGVVCQPITEEGAGRVLTLQSGCLQGVPATIDDVQLAGDSSEGFAQLAYNLINLGSRIIEQRLLVYRK